MERSEIRGSVAGVYPVPGLRYAPSGLRWLLPDGIEGFMLHRQPKIKRYVSAFISHKSDDNVEAKYYRNLLLTNGFTAWEYGGDSMPGCEISEFQETHIRDCHFFILLISDNSLKSEPVQRELGFA